MNQSKSFKYNAFLSYSHSADSSLAPQLQSAIEQYAKAWFQRRLLRVFRDETNLATNPNLWRSIKSVLAESEYLILLASVEAAASTWVAKEVEFWCEHRDIEKLIILVTDGEVEWDATTNDHVCRCCNNSNAFVNKN